MGREQGQSLGHPPRRGGTEEQELSWRLSCKESACQRRCRFSPWVGKIPHALDQLSPLELGGGNGAPLDMGGTLVLPLEWRRVCRGTS